MDKQQGYFSITKLCNAVYLFNIYGSIDFTALMNILIFLIKYFRDTFTTKCFKILKEFYGRQGFLHKNVNKICRMKIIEYNFLPLQCFILN